MFMQSYFKIYSIINIEMIDKTQSSKKSDQFLYNYVARP